MSNTYARAARRALVVEDEVGRTADLVVSVGKGGWLAERVATLAEVRALPLGGFAAFILDARLPDGDGLGLASELILHSPVLILTEAGDPTVANRSLLLGCEHAERRTLSRSLKGFLQRCSIVETSPTSFLNVERLADRCGLTEMERRVLVEALVSTSHDFLRARLGIAKGTLKAHVAAILGKSGCDTLEEVVIGLRADLLDVTHARKASGVRRAVDASRIGGAEVVDFGSRRRR